MRTLIPNYVNTVIILFILYSQESLGIIAPMLPCTTNLQSQVQDFFAVCLTLHYVPHRGYNQKSMFQILEQILIF